MTAGCWLAWAAIAVSSTGCRESSRNLPAPAVTDVVSEPPAETLPAGDSQPRVALPAGSEGQDSPGNDGSPPLAADEGRPELNAADPAGSLAQAIAEKSRETAAAADEQIPAERLLLLTPGGPLIVDLAITIANRPFAELQAATVAELLPVADSNGDGQTTWDEIFAHPRFRYGQFGNPPTSSYQEQQNLISIYDASRNGRVDPDELARYLTSNNGSSQPFSLRTSNFRREFNRLGSEILKWLDTDGDHNLSPLEIDQAADRLRARDQDLDEVLLPGDFAPSDGQEMARPTSFGPMAARQVNGLIDWYDVLYDLRELYASRGELAAADFSLVPELFAAIDRDANGRWDVEEIAELARIEPHLSLRVELDATQDAETVGTDDQIESAIATGRSPTIGETTPAAPPETADNADAAAGPPDAAAPIGVQDAPAAVRRPTRIYVTGVRLPLGAVEQQVNRTDHRITLALNGVTFDLFVNDSIGQAASASNARNLLRIGDANGDQYIDEDEYKSVQPQVGIPLDGVDLDGDAKIYLAEIEQTLRQRTLMARGQVLVSADDQADAMFSLLDRNYDGRIDGREIASSPRTLRSLDLNVDEVVQWHEIPGAMAICVARGNGNDPSLFQPPLSLARAADNVPRWFQGMDRNGDGGISVREFLGSRPQFEQLDKNRDGFVDTAEIQ